MDIGTKKEPGRELGIDEAREVNGGYIAPDLEDPPNQLSDDPLGPTGMPLPADYSQAVSGGEGCLTPPPVDQPSDPANPIWKAIEDAWNGIVP